MLVLLYPFTNQDDQTEENLQYTTYTLTPDVYIDHVIAQYGNTYDRDYIIKWLNLNH